MFYFNPMRYLIIIPIMAIALSAALIIACGTTQPIVVVKEDELEGKQWRAYQEIRERWMKEAFSSCLTKQHLKLSCSGCEYIIIVYRIVIDGKGRIVAYEKIRGNICGATSSPELEQCFIQYLTSITFPQPLRNMTIEVRLGTGLKC